MVEDGEKKKEGSTIWKYLLLFVYFIGIFLYLGVGLSSFFIAMFVLGGIFIFLFDFILFKFVKDGGIRAVVVITFVVFSLKLLSPLIENLFQ